MSFKENLLLFLAEYPGSMLLRLLGTTLRVRVFGKPYEEERQKGATKRVVYAFWHCHILPLALAYRGKNLRVMVSEHRDGEIIARVAQRLGIMAERGSTTRGGAKALRAMVRVKKDPAAGDVAITPDGPRGPARVAQSGAIFIAAKTGFPLVPVGAALGKAWVLSTWDRFQIPKPFARCAVVLGDEIDVPESLSDEGVEELTELLAERLQQAEQAASARLTEWTS
jgi:lysophospholipid acyltransferase (LPLAT)-like uncharacterized protein